MEHHHHKEKCCDPCDKRMQGIQGPQGVQGPKGSDGLQGPQGIEGPQGIPGNCVNCFPEHKPCDCIVEYAEVYSVTPQSLAPSPGFNLPGQVVLYENTIVATANIDVSQAGATGVVSVLRAGWYDVTIGICGSLNPIQSPLPVWTLSLFRNGSIVPGSTFSNMTISPVQQANQMTANVYVYFSVGDTLMLNNTSINQVELTSQLFGSNAQPVSAFLKLQLLEAK